MTIVLELEVSAVHICFHHENFAEKVWGPCYICGVYTDNLPFGERECFSPEIKGPGFESYAIIDHHSFLDSCNFLIC